MKARRKQRTPSIDKSIRYAARVMMVDPGLDETGFAVFDALGVWKECIPPIRVGVYKTNTSATDEMRARELFSHLDLWYTVEQCSAICIEKPRYEHSSRGQASANSGALLKLSMAAAVAMSVAFTHGGQGHWVSIEKWKGNLSKENVEKRIRKRLGNQACEEYRTHMWDAIGIGLYVKGHFG